MTIFRLAILMLALFLPVMSRFALAQSVAPSDRAELIRAQTARGGRPEDIEVLLRIADDTAAKKLPMAPVANKIREGLAKGVDPKRIELVARQIATNLEAADRLVRESDATSSGTAHDAAITLLAESLGSGVTFDEIREFRKLPSMTTDALANASRGLAFIKDAQLPGRDGSAVISEAVRKGFRPNEVLDVGREVKRREADYRSGRSTLRALRDAIARGERPEQLFRETRTDAATRPAATAARPEPVVERPAARPDTQRPDAQRPEQPARPERPAARETR